MAATCRVVAAASSFSDDTEHSLTLTDNVAPGETVVFFSGCSVTAVAGIVGYVHGDKGAPWTSMMGPTIGPEAVPTSTYTQFRRDIESDGTAVGNGVSCFSAYCPDGLASGTTLRFGVKWDANPTWYHGQSPFCFAAALNSGDGRFMVPDEGAQKFNTQSNVTSIASPSITSSNDAIVLGFSAGTTTAGAGWFTPGSGWTELVDTAQGTESNYNICGQYRIATSSFSGTHNGTSSVSASFGNIIASYRATTVEPFKGPPVLMLGTRASGTATDFASSGNSAAWPFTALETGYVTVLAGTLGTDNSTGPLANVKFGIYSDVAGAPTTLLGATPVLNPTPLFKPPVKELLPVPVFVVKGTQYWLAFCGNGTQLDISGVSSAGVGKEGTGLMVAKWVNAGNMQATAALWGEGYPLGSVRPGYSSLAYIPRSMPAGC